jgi:ATP-dependent helicase/DNAse subunit B
MGKKKPVNNLNQEMPSLSVKDILHLESAKYIKHDNSQYVLKPVQKKEEVFHPSVILTKSEVEQYFSTGKGNEADAKLAQKAQEAIEVLKEHSKQEEAKKANTTEKGNIETSPYQMEEVLNLDFQGLILDSVLKD